MRPKKVVIIGGSYYGNQGAALMLKSAMQGIKDHSGEEVKFDIWVENLKKNEAFCDDEDVNLIEFNPVKFVFIVIPALFLHRLIKGILKEPLYRSCIEADLFYDVSGISFIDDRKPLFLFYDYLINRPAFILKKPSIKGAQALGPFENKFNRFLSKRTLPKCTKIYARGKKTFESLQKLGLKNIKESSDLGFYWNKAPADIKEIGELKSPVIGISISAVVYGKSIKNGFDYLGILENIINFVNNSLNGSVVIVPHAIKINSEKLRNNDIKVIRILEERKKANFIYYEDKLGLNELRGIINKCDFMLVSRFHAMINALALKKPVMVLGWSHKYKEVLEMFEIGDEHLQTEKISSEEVTEQFNNSFNKKEKIQESISKNLERVKKLSEVNFELISEIL